MRSEIERLWELSSVAELRQCGFIAGIELKRPGAGGPTPNLGANVCLAARRHGLLTRAIRDVVVLLPPLCITPAQLTRAVEAIRLSILEVCESK
jgi:adenosylmethionine-8-amino-7-oxononanoate aminotransferase